MTGPKTSPIVTMKILVEEEVVPPVGTGLEFGRAAIHRATTIFSPYVWGRDTLNSRSRGFSRFFTSNCQLIPQGGSAQPRLQAGKLEILAVKSLVDYDILLHFKVLSGKNPGTFWHINLPSLSVLLPL